MKILLLNPPWPGKGYGTRSQNRIIKQRADLYIQYPIQMGYCASILKQNGHSVYYIDSVVDRLTFDETTEKIKKIMPDIILMETVTPSIDYDIKYIRQLKKITNAKFIITGPHVTYFSKETLRQCKDIDIIIKGDYDTKISQVVKNINNIKELKKIKGIAFRNKNQIIGTGKTVYDDNLDALPFPDRDIIPYWKYGEAWYNKKPFMNILTSRGCPYGCTFCISAHVMEGIRWRKRSIQNVIDELKYLVDKYNLKEINIDDPTFTIDKKRMIEFCRTLRKNKLKLLWTCNGRVDNVDDEVLIEMRKSGCKMIRYGIESANEEVLKSIKKGITVEQMKKAFKMTQKHGILALGGFMFGFPTDSKESIEQTLNLAKELKPDLIQASIPMAYPGTLLYEEAKKSGKIVAKSWKEYDMTYGPVVKTRDMTREYLDGILNRVYREFYFRPGFIIQTIFGIRRLSDISRVLRNFVTLVRTTLFYGKRKNNSCSTC